MALAFPLLLFIGLSFQAPAKSPELVEPPARKQAWDWSLDERLAARQEFVESRSPQIRRQAPNDASGPILDGSKNPELLLPGELFRQLLSLAFSPSAEVNEVFRQNIMTGAAGLNLPGEFWQRLELLAADYLGTRDQERELGARLQEVSVSERRRLLVAISSVQEPQCAYRYQALTAARSTFGAKLFDRFLYQAVAPLVQVTVTVPAVPAKLAWAEKGCK
jgi:hypothetical protein